jgi:hypothetical protein
MRLKHLGLSSFWIDTKHLKISSILGIDEIFVAKPATFDVAGLLWLLHYSIFIVALSNISAMPRFGVVFLKPFARNSISLELRCNN